MTHCCFQTYPQPTVLTELAHMGHLEEKNHHESSMSSFVVFSFSHVYILCWPPKKSTFSQKLQKSSCGATKLWSFVSERVIFIHQFQEPAQMQRRESDASTRETVQGSNLNDHGWNQMPALEQQYRKDKRRHLCARDWANPIT